MNAVTDEGLLQLLLLALHTVCALTAASHALLHKRDSRSAWGWIATCWLFPLMGATDDLAARSLAARLRDAVC